MGEIINEILNKMYAFKFENPKKSPTILIINPNHFHAITETKIYKDYIDRINHIKPDVKQPGRYPRTILGMKYIIQEDIQTITIQ